MTLAGTDVSSRIAIVRKVLKPISISVANLYGGYGALGNGILSTFRDYGIYSTFFGSQGIVYMPVTPTLPNNESNSAGVGANIPDNVNVLFSGRYATTFAELRYRPIATFVDLDRKELVAHLCLIVLMKRA